ncbi:MAG: hypothetical protein II251_04440 [Lachnospiraceae bacterium]|nr:hypothetical protein [Lachnospiraceae bacterium]
MKYTNKYDDIIELPHPVSKKHPQMSIHDRAAQFSAFAALTGHKAAIQETERLVDKKIELDENEIQLLNEKLAMVYELLDQHPEVEVTYFVKDSRKDGGKYVTVEGGVKKIDVYHQLLIFEDGTEVLVDNISEIVML